MTNLSHSDCVMRRKFSDRQDEQFIPDLIFLQKESFESFICLDNNDEEKKEKSKIQIALKEFFPLSDPNKNAVLEFIKYRVGEIKYTAKECLNSGRTYSIALYATLRLLIFEKSEESGRKEIKAIKDQEVFLCDIPLMTKGGSFIINGIERVVVSQMRRAPGVFFDSEDAKLFSGKVYTAKIIPLAGSWVDFEFDGRDILYFRIDKKRKIPVTSLFKVLNMSVSDVLKYFYKETNIKFRNGNWISDFNFEGIVGKSFGFDIINAKTNEIVIPKNRKITKRTINQLKESGFKEFILDRNFISSYVLADDVMDSATGEIILPVGTQLDEDKLVLLQNLNIEDVSIVNPESSEIGPYIFNTFGVDKNTSLESVVVDIYKAIRTGEEPMSVEAAQKFVDNLLFSSRFNLSEVGRMKANYRLGIDVPMEITHLTKDDILSTVKILSKIKHNDEKTDDIDNLMNRRLRAAGELIENQFRVGISRIEKTTFII